LRHAAGVPRLTLVDLSRSFDDPDEIVEVGGTREEIVTIGGLTISRNTTPPGWRWSEHVKPLIGGEWCTAHHVGFVLSGHMAVELADGTTMQLGPGDLYDIPPGHDGHTVGDGPAVSIEWSGAGAWAGGSLRHRVVRTVVFTDVVDSTGTASRLGDAAWHDVLSMHLHTSRDSVERAAGRLVKTTGDGILAAFEATVGAVRCALSIRDHALRQGVSIRAGVHIGEVELAGDDVRGITVHEANRIMAVAGPDAVLVSEPIVALCKGAGLTFEDAGEHELKGVPDRWRLYRVVG
jgi:class 3 adenylate cyclase